MHENLKFHKNQCKKFSGDDKQDGIKFVIHKLLKNFT